MGVRGLYIFGLGCKRHQIVTRFGKISPLWQKFTTPCQCLMVYSLFCKALDLLWQVCDIIGQLFIVANGQILKII